MSLQVWLPLTKDTRNQGLLNLPTPWDARIRDTGGKLGQYCYSDNAIYHIENEWLGNEWSLVCWVKSSGWGQYNDIILCKNTTDSSNAQFYLSIIGGAWLNIGCNSGSETLKINYTFATNTWYHVAATYDGTTLKLYLNGSEIGTKAYTSIQKTGMNNLGIGCRSTDAAGTNATGGSNKRMNDIRIYDHALSPFEIKEISKGLILHYPLNRNGWEQENNIAVSKIANRGCTNFVYNLSTQEWTMTCPAASSAWGYGIVINDRDIKWAINQTWIISMEVYVPHSITWNCDINNKPDLTDISEYTGNDYDIAGQRLVCTNGIKGSKTLQAGWNKIWFSQTANTTYGLTNYSTNWGIQTTNESSDIDIKIRKIKGEVIASGLPIQPTSWCPNSSDALATTMGLNDNVEYDTSGYGNNGTRTGTFSWTSDTPKYNVSTGITAGGGIFIPMNITFSQYTIAFWAKHTVKSKMLMGSCPSAGTAQTSWYWYGDNSFKYPSGEYYYTHNGGAQDSFKWTHFVATYDGANVRVYRNGVSEGSKACTGDQAMAYLSVGYGYAGGYTEDSNMSDFRIYATALSADDVKSLYNNSAYIDNQGNIYGAVYEEV